jgi:hypothetical protein
MAEVIVKIKDIKDGKVEVLCEPNFATMMEIDISGSGLTAAHGYAMKALNAIRAASKEEGGKMEVGIPLITGR